MILTTPFSAAFALGPWLLHHLLALFPLGPPPYATSKHRAQWHEGFSGEIHNEYMIFTALFATALVFGYSDQGASPGVLVGIKPGR